MDVSKCLSENVTPHFKWKEFFVTHYNNLQNYIISDVEERNLRYLASFLEGLRGIINKPIRLNSAYRSTFVNKQVGGVPNSFHLRGLACDISTIGYTPSSYFSLGSVLLDYKQDGILKEVIFHSNFIHIALYPPKI